MSKSNQPYVYDPNVGPAVGVRGARPDEELQLQQVRLLPSDESLIESRGQVELKRDFAFPHAGVTLKMLPLMAANMFGVGTVSMAQALSTVGMPVALEKHTTPASIIALYNNVEHALAFPSAGFRNGDEERLDLIFKNAGANAPKAIVIDVPNGHMAKMVETIKHYRQKYPQIVLIAGNVATGTMAAKLIQAGADAVKVGIGPGSACTTKLIAGTHRPQFAAIRDCAQAAHKEGGFVIADGGVQTAGDAAIALAAGGDIVMMGGVMSGHEESGVPIYVDEANHHWLKFMGSSSTAYMDMTQNGGASHRAAEGKEKWVPYKGSVLAPGGIVNETMGGLRSALSYAGVRSTEEFSVAARHTYSKEVGGLYLVKADVSQAHEARGPQAPQGKLETLHI